MRSGERSVLSGTYYITSTRASKTRSVPGVGWELLRIILFLYTGIFPYMCVSFSTLFFSARDHALDGQVTREPGALRTAHGRRSRLSTDFYQKSECTPPTVYGYKGA